MNKTLLLRPFRSHRLGLAAFGCFILTLLGSISPVHAQWIELNAGLAAMSQSSDPAVESSGATLHALCYDVVSTATVTSESVELSDADTPTQCIDVPAALINTVDWSAPAFQTATLLRVRVSSDQDVIAISDLVLPNHVAFTVFLFEVPVTPEQINNWSSNYPIYYTVSIPQ
jgi:hypothetical protein